MVFLKNEFLFLAVDQGQAQRWTICRTKAAPAPIGLRSMIHETSPSRNPGHS